MATPLKQPVLKDQSLPLHTVYPPRPVGTFAATEEAEVLASRGSSAFIPIWSADKQTCTFRVGNYTKAETNLLSHHIPEPLSKHQLFSQSSLDAMGVTEHDMNKTYLFEAPSGAKVVAVKRTGPSLLRDLGLLDMHNDIRQRLHSKAFLERIERIPNKKKDHNTGERKRDRPQFGNTWIPHSGIGRIQPSSVALAASKKDNFGYRKLILDITTVYAQVHRHMLPELEVPFMEHCYYAYAPVPFGSASNRGYWSALRLNHSALNRPISEGLGSYGGVHNDPGDEV